MEKFLSEDWALRLGQCVGAVERLSGVAPSRGTFGNMLNAGPLVWLTQYHLGLIKDDRLPDEAEEEFREIFEDFPAEDAKLRMDAVGQTQFMLGYQQGKASHAADTTDWRAARKTAGLKQKEALEQLGISQAALSRIENGKVTPRPKTAAKMRELYGI